MYISSLIVLALNILPLFVLARGSAQIPLMPPVGAYPETTTTSNTNQITLADLLTITPTASIFYSYARELHLSEILSQAQTNSTLLVPTNKAIMALSRKPHQGPEPSTDVDHGIEISEVEYDKMSKANVERWIRAHIIQASPIKLSDQTHETLLSGKSVYFKSLKGKPQADEEWKNVALEGTIPIIGMREAVNGVMYTIDGTVDVDALLSN